MHPTASSWQQPPAVVRYSSALLLSLVAVVLTREAPVLREHASYPVLFTAVVLSSWRGGLGPGLLATVTCAVGGVDFVFPSANSVAIDVAGLLDAGAFTLIAVLTSSLVAARHAAESRLAYLAFHDELTGLPNRTFFLDYLNRALSQASRSAATIAVLCLDLDGFKHINDQLGHLAGNAVLAGVGKRLCEGIRGGDAVARIGGDEFTVLLASLDQRAQAQQIAERLIEHVGRPFALPEGRGEVSLSIGIAYSAAGAVPALELFKRADAALYGAKQEGKQRFVEWQEAPKTSQSFRNSRDGI